LVDYLLRRVAGFAVGIVAEDVVAEDGDNDLDPAQEARVSISTPPIDFCSLTS
jgi:hypothetical protein